jgi:DNA-binding MarR family transcriptional regulator
MLPNDDERPLTAWVALVQAHSVIMEGVENRLVAEAGLPVSWYEVLVRLSRADEEKMRMQDLARAVLLSKSGLTRLADRMEAAGLVERRACASDRRVTYIALTERGRESLERAQPLFASAVERHLADHLAAEDLDRLTGALQRVIRGNGEAVDECAAPAGEPVASPARSA